MTPPPVYGAITRPPPCGAISVADKKSGYAAKAVVRVNAIAKYASQAGGGVTAQLQILSARNPSRSQIKTASKNLILIFSPILISFSESD